MSVDQKKKYTSDICIDGKRISSMREIAKGYFRDSFLFIEVYDGRFVITANDKIDIDSYDHFTEKFKLCRVRIYSEIDIATLRGKRKK